MISRNLLAIILCVGLAGSALAADGEPSPVEDASIKQVPGSGECSCTARHESATRVAIERYYASAFERKHENPEEALRLTRLILELDPDHDGARNLLTELESQ